MRETCDVKSLRAAAESGRIHWHQHALERLLERGIERAAVRQALLNGEVIEMYVEDRPHPSCLMAHIEREPLHVVASFDSEAEVCHVITCYRPDLERFEPDWKTRRRKS